MSAYPAHPVGSRFGPYDVLEVAGLGGMGVIYKARDRNLDRLVALKFLPARMARDRRARHRFLREARALARIEHPNIPSIYTIDRAGDTFYIACQYVEGSDLVARLDDDAPVEVDEALRIVQEVASALQATHEQGIVHRDIKPENIMMDPNGRVVVLDFGLAKRIVGDVRVTQSDLYLGTPEYCSPEQLRGEELDERTDLYALGVVLHELLCGRPPYSSRDTTNLHRAILAGRRTPLRKRRADLPRGVEALVDRLLERDRERRIGTAGEVIARIQALRGALADDDRRPGPRSRGGRLLRMMAASPLWVALGGATLFPWLARLRDRLA